jgi:DNA-binding FrmR family transcriptional regulator
MGTGKERKAEFQGVRAMLTDTKKESLKRLNYIEGHIAGIKRMVEDEKYCVDVLKQTYAVRRAIEKLESLLLDGHLHTCVVEGVKDGREEQVVGELLELYSLNSK